MSIIYGGQYGDPYINNSGGALAVGDVVVQDTSANDYVDTTVVEGDPDVAGVVIRGGADTEPVRVSSTGVVQVKVDGATARGDLLRSSTTATRATPETVWRPGVFAVAVTSVGALGIVWARLLLDLPGLSDLLEEITGAEWGQDAVQDGWLWNDAGVYG